MARIWVTYAWADNEDGDVDFAVQELRGVGLEVRLDRWNIRAGVRLWEQIEEFISAEGSCDAWLLYATQNSLGSEPCREEFAYALDRALSARGSTFPIIGLFPSTVDRELIPAGIRTRLHVSLTDPEWKERIRAAAEQQDPEIQPAQVRPFAITIHENVGGRRYVIELRPRAGSWSPVFAAIPVAEKESVNMNLRQGPRGNVPGGGILYNVDSNEQHGCWLMSASNEVTPTQSLFVFCDVLPSEISFGPGQGDQFTLPLRGS